MGLASSSQTHFYNMAGGRGVEPRFTESESVVLPLNDPPIPKPHSAEGKAHSVLLMIISLLLQTFNPLTPPLSLKGRGEK